MPRQPTKPTNLLISTPLSDLETVPDQTVCPGSSGRERAHDGTGAGSALNNGRGFGGDCARGHACQGGSSGVQVERAGGKHAIDCTGSWLARGLHGACSVAGTPWSALQQCHWRAGWVCESVHAHKKRRSQRIAFCGCHAPPLWKARRAGGGYAFSAFTTASPICAVPTLVVPSL